MLVLYFGVMYAGSSLQLNIISRIIFSKWSKVSSFNHVVLSFIKLKSTLNYAHSLPPCISYFVITNLKLKLQFIACISPAVFLYWKDGLSTALCILSWISQLSLRSLLWEVLIAAACVNSLLYKMTVCFQTNFYYPAVLCISKKIWVV